MFSCQQCWPRCANNQFQPKGESTAKSIHCLERESRQKELELFPFFFPPRPFYVLLSKASFTSHTQVQTRCTNMTSLFIISSQQVYPKLHTSVLNIYFEGISVQRAFTWRSRQKMQRTVCTLHNWVQRNGHITLSRNTVLALASTSLLTYSWFPALSNTFENSHWRCGAHLVYALWNVMFPVLCC